MTFTTPQAQEQLIGYWAKKIGLTHSAITKHPCADDIVLLYRFRSEFRDLPSFEYKRYLKISDSVVKQKKPLTNKQLRQLEHLAKKMASRRSKQEQQINTIQTRRSYKQKIEAEIQQENHNAGL